MSFFGSRRSAFSNSVRASPVRLLFQYSRKLDAQLGIGGVGGDRLFENFYRLGMIPLFENLREMLHGLDVVGLELERPAQRLLRLAQFPGLFIGEPEVGPRQGVGVVFGKECAVFPNRFGVLLLLRVAHGKVEPRLWIPGRITSAF